jgi:unsaturated rhamnogalacturonyl hydrolase
MKMSRHTNFLHVVIFLVFVAAVPPNAARGQDDFLPSRSEVGAVMRQVNDYWIDRHPDPGDNLWAQSVYFIGNMAHYSATGKEEYLNYAVDWAVQHNWRINGCGTGVSAIADNQAAGQTFLALYQLEPDQAKVDCIINSINNNVHRYLMLNNQNKIIENQWWHLRWIDELFMAMPVYAQLSVDYDDSDYLETMYALYRNLKITRGLYNADAGLWYRDEKFIPNEDDKDIFWSRGNGWAFAAHARILAILPESAPHHDEYRTTFQTMAAVLKAAQRSDGFWNVDLADANDFPGPETSGTALFTYGMAAGIGMGILDHTEYAETVTKAWNGMVHSAVHPDGKLGFVQGVAAQPAGNFTYDTTADFGVGAFLLAGSAIYSLTEDYGPANLALSRPVDCSSEPQGENGCAHTVDGDLINRWSALGFPQWVEVDLGEVCLINGVSVHPYKSRAYRYYVEVKL